MAPESALVLFVTVGVSFGILHFFLWLYSPETKNNLFFAVYAFIFSFVVFCDYHSSLVINQSAHLANIYFHLHRLLMPFLLISLLLLVYSAFNEKIPGWFLIFATGIVLTGIWISFKPYSRYNYFYIWLGLSYIELSRVLVKAVKKKKTGTWIIVLGFLFFVVFSFYDVITDLNIIHYIGNIQNGYTFGFLGMTACFSIYLARDFSIRNQRILEEQKKAQDLVFQKKVLEEEDKRKSQELEQARELQLSMLPDADHQPAELDIATRMLTATEVGGDYYDFRHNDKEIIIAIGDALGHGMRAGMIVTVIKSLFVAETDLNNFVTFFHKCSRVFHTMKLRKLFMGLQLIRFEQDRMILATAGMPPVLIYRKATGEVETVIQKSMPLGGPASFPYIQNEITINSGDIVVMMSDGITERFNRDRHMLGQKPIQKWLQETADQDAETILDTILTKTDEWAQTEQRDDITLVVTKIR
jgi:serine phosphatase RsbU (regulator of sigma subunit)